MRPTLTRHASSIPRRSKIPRRAGPQFRLVVTLCAILFAVGSASAAELAVNLYGVSYHFERQDVHGQRFNEFNYGLGARFNFAQQRRSSYFIETAMFRDSFRRTARYGVLGYDYRAFGGLSVGFVIGLYDSRAVSPDGSIVAAAPMLSYRVNNVSLHFVHLPEFAGINPYPSIALYASISVWSPHRQSDPAR